MTQPNDQPTGKVTEVPPSDAAAVASKLAESAQLTGPLLGAEGSLTHLQALDHRGTGEAFAGGLGHAALGALNGIVATAGIKAETTEQVKNRLAHNLAAPENPNIFLGLATGAVKTLAYVGTHPLTVAAGLKDGITNFGHSVTHGTANEKAEAWGGAAFLVGTVVIPFAGSLAKLGTEGEALGLAGRAGDGVLGAKALVTTYREGATVASDVAVAQAEQRLATALTEKTLAATERALAVKPVTSVLTEASVAVKPVTSVLTEASVAVKPVTSVLTEASVAVKPVTSVLTEASVAARPAASVLTEASVAAKPAVALEAVTPATTTFDVGARLHLPTLEPITPGPGVISRVAGNLTNRFKSMFATSEGAAGESTVGRFPNLIKENPSGGLATRVDGLKDVATGTVQPAERLAAGERAAAGNVQDVLPATKAGVSETHAVIASKAGDHLADFSRLTSEKGVVLAPEAELSLQQLTTQLKAVAENGEGALSQTAREAISKNIVTVERSLPASGTASAADAAVTKQFSQFKAAVNELAPAPIAPIAETPVVLASKAGENLQSFAQSAAEQRVILSTDAEQSLQNINTQVKALSQSNALPLTAQASTQLAQDLATVDSSLASSGADGAVLKQFSEVRASIKNLSTAAVEREQIGVLNNSLSTLDTQGAELSTSVKNLAQQFKDMPALSALDQQAASTISNRLEALELKLNQGALTEAPVATSSEIQQLVRDLDRPEYSSFFAKNAEATKVFEEVKASTTSVAATASKVESAQIGIGGIRQTEIFQQNVDGLAAMSKDLQGGLAATEAAQPVATALKSIESDLATIRGGANPEAVFRRVQANIETIDTAGAGNIANELKQGLGDLENTSTALDRTRRLEANVATIRTTGSALDSQAGVLSKEFEATTTTPSTTSMLPNNAQVSDQLELISRQARLVDGSEAGAAAVNKIKDAFTRVKELTTTTTGTLTDEQNIALQRIGQSIDQLDQASVEATGLRSFEVNARQIAQQSGRVETLSAGIAKSVDLRSGAAVDAQLEQRLTKINQAAQDVRTAGTFEKQVAAVNRLGTAVDDPELQAYFARNQAMAQSLKELQASTAELHESVSFRALERSQSVAVAEAENSATAARALEARVQNDVALAGSPSLPAAVADYRQVAESFAGASDKNLVAAQMEQKLGAIRAQFAATAPGSTVVDGEEMAALQRAQAGVSQSVVDSELMSRSLIDRRLPVIENGFDQIGKASSTVVQRELIGNLSRQLQNLRALDRVGDGADQLAQAQMQLTRAQNDLEVATYRGNLVKMAAAGDQAAVDRLLVSGLKSDGFKATSMAGTSGPAARLIEDFTKNRSNLQGLLGQASSSVRSLSASDPLFVNNGRWLSANVIRNTGFGLMGVGALTAGSGYHLEHPDKAGSTDNATAGSLNQASQSAQSSFAPNGPAGVTDAPAGQASSAERNAAIVNASGGSSADGTVTTASGSTNGAGAAVAPESRAIGRSAGEPNGFSSTGQLLARTAFSQDLANQAVPRTASILPAGGNGDNLPNSLRLVPSDNGSSFRPSIAQAGPFTVYNNDVNKDAELYRLQYSGQLWGPKFAGDVAAEAGVVVPFTLAQTLHIGGGGHGAGKGLEKPATSQFNMPQTLLASPFALAAGVGQKPGLLTTRLGGYAYGGAAGTVPRPGDASVNLSLHDADAEGEEGGTVGTKNSPGKEKTESRGIDPHAGQTGPGTPTAQAGGTNDEEGNGLNDPDPTVTASATSPTAERRVPPSTQPGQSPAVAVVAQADDQAAANPGTPPRRRATNANTNANNKDAISA
jgi:hypothetical protein